MAIVSVESLRVHLQWALQVEMTTVAPYLYAMYSVADQERDAAKLIRSVVTEEMLHATIAANLLTAIGGRPRFYDRSVAPTYPCVLPHHDPPLPVELRPLDARSLELFLTIERPDAVQAPPADDNYETLGQFYLAIEEAFARVDDGTLFADPRVECQVALPEYYAAVEFDSDESGGLEPIVDQASVRRAIETVMHQGEGLHDHRWADPSHQELTHYHKFLAIRDGEADPGEILPLPENPKTADYADEVRPVSTWFNAALAWTWATLDDLYRPMGDDARRRLVGRLYALMNGTLGPIARYLTTLPSGIGATRAAPTFEFYPLRVAEQARDEVAELGEVAVAAHPALKDVLAALPT